MRHWSVLPSGPLSSCGPTAGSSTRCWVVWPPPHRWRRQWPRPNRHGPAWELSLCRSCREDKVRDEVGWFIGSSGNQSRTTWGLRLLTPVALHASGSGRHSPLCFCSGGPPIPKRTKHKCLHKGKHDESDNIIRGSVSYLHPGLHHIKWRVSKNTGGAGRRAKHRCDNWVHLSSGIVPCEAESISYIAWRVEEIRGKMHQSLTGQREDRNIGLFLQ